ncbi:unnamed protein product [Nezara viridula]|uniref:non-specific serine/threonine protein kinase n=1 Tax=Nezara viridula TaxID=85310 RepID=A0A9P0HIQ7_NEZVI|nr:unnamed protein product [Nezara viridula]
METEPGTMATTLKDEKGPSHKRQSSSDKIVSLLHKLPQLGEIFELHYKVGEGTFSNVYLATFREVPKAKFAVKHLIPTCHPSRVIRELKCMQEIGGVDNVVGIYMCLRMNDCITFVMPYQHHDKFTSYLYDMDIDEIRLYIRELCVALRRVHSFGVIHRDVKPGNFLYNRAKRKFLLVDFGLAQKVGEWSTDSSKKRKRCSEGENKEPAEVQEQNAKRICLKERPSEIKRAPLHACNENISFIRSFSQVCKEARPNLTNRCECDRKARVCNTCLSRKGGSAPRAGTPGFRAPEVLLKSHDQTTAVDMWAVGVILLCLLSRTYPFFRAPDDVTALAEMITVFGSEEIKSIATKLGRHVVCSETCKPLDLREACKFLRERRRRISNPVDIDIPDEAFSLLYRLLDLDHTSRITAEETLSHPFLAKP